MSELRGSTPQRNIQDKRPLRRTDNREIPRYQRLSMRLFEGMHLMSVEEEEENGSEEEEERAGSHNGIKAVQWDATLLIL